MLRLVQNVKGRPLTYFLLLLTSSLLLSFSTHRGEIVIGQPLTPKYSLNIDLNSSSLNADEWRMQGEASWIWKPAPRFKNIFASCQSSVFLSIHCKECHFQGRLSAVQPKRAFAALPCRDSCHPTLRATQPTLCQPSPSKVRDKRDQTTCRNMDNFC